MTKTNLFSVIGTAKYAKVFPRNKDNNEDYHGPGGAYTIDLLMEKEELDKFTKSGSRLKPNLTEDGVSVKFKRKHNPPTRKNGSPIEEFGGPPRVVDHENKPWDDTVSIGNGSVVEVWFTVYDTRKGKGTRLEGIRVIEHVPYETDGEYESGVRLPF